MTQSGFIYAIGVAGHASVKIGRTTTTVTKRLAALQTAHPAPLAVLAQVPVDHDLARIEKAVHRFLAADRQHGEWFACAMDQDQLEALIVRAVQWLANEEATGMEMLAPVGCRIRRIRRAQDLTQEALAEKTGLNVITISRLENATAKAVYADTVLALAQSLGVSADYLLGLSDTEEGGMRNRKVPIDEHC